MFTRSAMEPVRLSEEEPVSATLPVASSAYFPPSNNISASVASLS